MQIETERLILIPCDQDTYRAYLESYEMGPHIIAYLQQLEQDFSVYGWGVWLAIEKESNEAIGDLGFKGKPNVEKTVEIGYGIAPTARGHGFATEAVRALLDWAFRSPQVEKVVAECLESNAASIHVLEKVGMKRTHTKDGMIYWERTKRNE
ncbi:GNAT family N-acetyltransferase [Anoxybacteroides tepidamans]|uniref:GNAT family N-acetyltransferase n=1 Tax=Anoxybacteroides tepidamans TaxID=265948 RepID=UPI000487FE3D|nr:GNAT family N-acetyltransferase [Anoxybacillus tepidamans]